MKKNPLDIGQGDTLPKEVWLLMDKDNGHPGSHRYCWWFPTEKEAIEHKKWQKKSSKYATALAGPFRFVYQPPVKNKVPGRTLKG